MSPFKIVLLSIFMGAITLPATAQEAVRWSGLVYMDYEYIFSSSDEEDEGENGFDYRRLYLTADYKLSDEFSGRARLEAKSGPSTTYPFVKDLYIKWKGALGKGHDLVAGIQSPPSFTASEKAWGYRSIQKTIMDRQKIVSSRDFGIAAKGKLPSNLSYGVMLANNNSTKGENDRYKRIYGQVAWQPDNLVLTVGGDFASGEDENITSANAFAGYKAADFRAGVEGYYQSVDFDHSHASADRSGISVWVVKPVNEEVDVIARVDYVEMDVGIASIEETFFIGGVAFSPNPKVHIIPNVYVVDSAVQEDLEVAGRVTIHADF